MPGDKQRATLIHNAKAGDARHSGKALTKLLRKAGYDVAYCRYKHCDLAEALERPADLVVIAGGDGTVANVAAACRPGGPPIAVLPLGTANNLARSLRIEGSPEQLVESWGRGRLRPFYPIEAIGPWGSCRLVEGLGFGAFEQALFDMPPDPDFGEARGVYAAATMSAAPEQLELRCDGEVLAAPFAVLEITRIVLFGPNLRLAPAADPSERTFDICFVYHDSDSREALARWLTRADATAPPPVAFRRVERATIAGQFRRLRLNARLWPKDGTAQSIGLEPIRLTTAAEPLLFLVPG